AAATRRHLGLAGRGRCLLPHFQRGVDLEQLFFFHAPAKAGPSLAASRAQAVKPIGGEEQVNGVGSCLRRAKVSTMDDPVTALHHAEERKIVGEDRNACRHVLEKLVRRTIAMVIVNRKVWDDADRGVDRVAKDLVARHATYEAQPLSEP